MNADSIESDKTVRSKQTGATPAATATVPVTTVSYSPSGSAVTFSSNRPTNSPIAVVTPSIIRRSASDSHITFPLRAPSATNSTSTAAAAGKPYNKDNYGAGTGDTQDSFANDSIDATTVESNGKQTAEKSSALLDVLAGDQSSNQQAQDQNQVIVQTVGIEGHFASAMPQVTRHHRNAWTAPDRTFHRNC